MYTCKCVECACLYFTLRCGIVCMHAKLILVWVHPIFSVSVSAGEMKDKAPISGLNFSPSTSPWCMCLFKSPHRPQLALCGLHVSANVPTLASISLVWFAVLACKVPTWPQSALEGQSQSHCPSLIGLEISGIKAIDIGLIILVDCFGCNDIWLPMLFQMSFCWSKLFHIYLLQAYNIACTSCCYCITSITSLLTLSLATTRYRLQKGGWSHGRDIQYNSSSFVRSWMMNVFICSLYSM
jgi:hypothetical protein